MAESAVRACEWAESAFELVELLVEAVEFAVVGLGCSGSFDVLGEVGSAQRASRPASRC